MGDYIKIYRSMLEWEWYSDINTSRLFLHMLLKANWKDGRFQGEFIPRGSFPSSVKKLAQETSLSEKEVRTALSHLKKTGEVASKPTNKFTVFSINNYDCYQSRGEQKGKQEPDKGQAEGNQRATIEEKKEKKESNNTMCKADADALFERLWKLYPNKRGKGTVEDANKRHLLDIGFEEMERAINRYKADLAEESWRKPQNGSTFFNGGYVDYLDNNYEPLVKKKQDKSAVVHKFNAFPQREYSKEDYAEIEKRMLQRR